MTERPTDRRVIGKFRFQKGGLKRFRIYSTLEPQQLILPKAECREHSLYLFLFSVHGRERLDRVRHPGLRLDAVVLTSFQQRLSEFCIIYIFFIRNLHAQLFNGLLFVIGKYFLGNKANSQLAGLFMIDASFCQEKINFNLNICSLFRKS